MRSMFRRPICGRRPSLSTHGIAVAHHTRPAQYRHVARSRPLERTGAGPRGRPGGVDIVDQDDPPTLQPGTHARIDGEGPGDSARPRGTAKPAQHRGGAFARDQIEHQFPLAQPGKRAGDQRRLIIAARPQPPAMERHWRHQCPPQHPGRGTMHVARHRGGDAWPPPIFELERQRPRDRPISDGGTDAIEGRRIGQARTTARIVVERQRQRLATDRTGWAAQKIQRLPAGEAETVVVRHDHAAARAAGRQREGDDPPENAAQGDKRSHHRHRRLVLRRA